MKSKNILITGGTSGIGKDFIYRYEFKNRIININRDSDIVKTIKEHGKINGFVHFAGIQYLEPISMFSREKFEETMWSNVGLSLEIIKTISKKQYSSDLSIILISSVAALKGDPCLSQYSASKGALISLTKSLAVELAPKGIRVNCISPGIVEDTRMSNRASEMMGKEKMDILRDKHLLGFGSSEDVCNLIEFLLSDKAKWITGQNFIIDGGYTA